MCLFLIRYQSRPKRVTSKISSPWSCVAGIITFSRLTGKNLCYSHMLAMATKFAVPLYIWLHKVREKGGPGPKCDPTCE